jgi:hypothetical protein
MLLAFAAKAQETCLEKLLLANNHYENGQLQKAISLASNCVESENFQDQWQACRLLAMAYLANDQRIDARKYARKMLELNPKYQPSKANDPTELIRMLESFKVLPKYTMGFAGSVGVNATYPTIQNTFNGSNYSKDYKSLSGWQAGAIFGYNMNEFIGINLGLTTFQKNFQIDYTIEGNDISLKESNTYLNFPLFARFRTSPFKKVRYFVDIGIYSGRLLSSNVDAKRYSTSLNESVEYNNLDAMNRRNKWEYGSVFGAGIAYKTPKFDIAIGAKYYAASFYNLTNSDNRYTDDYLFYKMYYLDDDMRLNDFCVSLSVLYSINFTVLKDKE